MGLRQSLRIAASTLLLACGLQFAHADSSPQTIVFGVAPGPYGDMVKQAIAPTLKEKGYKVVVREFSDYVQPNMALANGSIDANLFQHTLYFDKFTADKGLKLSKLIVVPTAGMGFYSRKINSLDALKKGTLLLSPTIRLTWRAAFASCNRWGLSRLRTISIRPKPLNEISPAIQKDWFSNRWKPHSYRARWMA